MPIFYDSQNPSIKLKWYSTREMPATMQYTISIVSVLFVASLCYLLKGVIGYKLAALVLLMTVSVIAALFEILPVTISALSSSFILNFFFIPPLYTLRIGNAEDLLMLFCTSLSPS